ncbi:MAG: thrombospondin type 3 repeat-containing protein [Deltaproteobacteria bacterium]|nr:thrombospondin type 3 repeat-containing protein [Deltaproteobacteria bacterium]
MRGRGTLLMLLCSWAFASCGAGADAPSPPEPEEKTESALSSTSPPPAAEETLFPSPEIPPSPPDADGDGIPDTDDNCPAVANPDQTNWDRAQEAEILGDACDDDDDNDGLTDDEERGLGVDWRITNPLDPDTDKDGVHDGLDNCPAEINVAQYDNDGDGFGDDDQHEGSACDCNDSDGTIHPAATDDPDVFGVDRNCDGVDGEELEAIFASPVGDDTQLGTRHAPVRTVALAAALAGAEGKDVYLAAGEYDTTALVWPAQIRIFGGYAPDFSARDVRMMVSELVAGGATTLTIAPPAQAVTLDGVTLRNEGADLGSTVLQVAQAEAVVRYSSLLGSLSSNVTYGAIVAAGGELRLEGSFVDPGGEAGSAASVGLLADGGDVTLINNIIRGGNGDQTEGVVLRASLAILLHNTIDGGSSGPVAHTAVALRFADSAPLLLNNILLTHGPATDQVALWCEEGQPVDSKLHSNLFAALPAGQYNPLLVNCEGDFFYEAADLPAAPFGAGSSASANADFAPCELLSQFVHQLRV